MNNTHEELLNESLKRIHDLPKEEIFFCKDLYTKKELESISTRVRTISRALCHDVDTVAHGYKALGKRKDVELYQRI